MDWRQMLANVTGTVDQELLARNEYLLAENRILRGQIKGCCARGRPLRAQVDVPAGLRILREVRRSRACCEHVMRQVDLPAGAGGRMFHHLDLNVSDLARSNAFYGALLARLGYVAGEAGAGWTGVSI